MLRKTTTFIANYGKQANANIVLNKQLIFGRLYEIILHALRRNDF